jgi:hypothetical protein
MSDNSPSYLQAVPEYVDQVARKERFLARHAEAVIGLNEAAPPYERWHGRLPGHEQIVSGDLGRLLDRLEELIAADAAAERWPGWTFTRIGSQWKAQETAGTRVVFGPSLRAAEARVGLEERASGSAGVLSQYCLRRLANMARSTALCHLTISRKDPHAPRRRQCSGRYSS